MKSKLYILALVIMSVMYACSNTHVDNPLFSESEINISEVKTEHFKPAFTEALRLHKKEIQKIYKDNRIANFSNTVAALDSSGKMLKKVYSILLELYPAKDEIEIKSIKEWADSKIEKHNKEIYANKRIGPRVWTVYNINIINKGVECGPNRVCEVVKGIYSAKPEVLTTLQEELLKKYAKLYYPKLFLSDVQ